MKKILVLALTLFAFSIPANAQRVVKAERYKFEKTVTAPDPTVSYYLQRIGTSDTLCYIHLGVRYYIYPSGVSASGLKDSTVKGFGFYNITATDSSILFEARESGETVSEIRAVRTGGTSASINVTKNGSSDLLTANYVTTTSIASAGTLQNNTLVIGDIIRVAVRAEVGTITEIFVQLTIKKNQL